MLAILLSWLITTVVFFSVGYSFIRLCNKVSGQQSIYSAFDVAFLGLCITGTILCIVSIWFPVNYLSLVGLLAFSLLYWVLNISNLKELFNDYKARISLMSRKDKINIILILCITVYFSILPPFSFDQDLYHLQAIKWNETYSVVPGLANLHDRFGLNPNYLVLCPAFSLQQLFGQPIYAINSLCTLYLLLFITFRLLKSKNPLVDYGLFALCLLLSGVYYKNISSTSTDILPNILVIYVLFRVILDPDSVKNSSLLYWVIPVYCLTLKLSIFPICFLTVMSIFFIIRSKQFSFLYILLLASIVILLPWFTRNVILSGYLIFPFPAIDLFNPDWKVPVESAQSIKEWIHSWGRIPGESKTVVLSMSMDEWVPIWFSKIKPYDKLLFITSLIAPVLMLILFLKRKKNGIHPLTFCCWIISFIGFAFWFFSAPDFRFSYSFIIMGLLPFILLFNKKNWRSTISLSQVNLLVLSFLIFAKGVLFIYHKTSDRSFSSFISSSDFTECMNIGFFKNICCPEICPIPVAEDYFTTWNIDNTTIYYPSSAENYQCFGHEIPCTTHYDSRLRLRGDSLQKGFRTE